MFSRQTPDLVRQLRGHVPDPVVQALEGLIGNRDQKLEHRAPVRIEIDGNYLPSIHVPPRGGPIPRNCSGTAKAALTVANRAGKFVKKDDCNTKCVDGGLALRAIGPSHMDEVRIDRLLVGELLDECGEPIPNPPDGGGGGGPGAAGICRFRILVERPVVGNDSIALARPIVWNGTSYTPSDQTIAVVDFTPTKEFSSRWRTNFYGFCTWKDDRNTVNVNGTDYPCREVVWVESYSRFVEFQLSTTFDAQEAEATVLRAWGSTANVPTEETIVVTDRLNKIPNAQIGYTGIAIHDEKARKYIVLADDDAGVPVPSESNIRCIKVTGPRRTDCIYPAKEITKGNFSGICSNEALNDVGDVWVSFPNMENDVMPGTYNFAKLIHPAFDIGGVVRPLLVSLMDPENFAVLRITKESLETPACLYPAKRLQVDYSSARNVSGSGSQTACGISDVEVEDVLIFMPEFGECNAVPNDRVVIAQRIGPGLYFNLEHFQDHCAQLALIGNLTLTLSCIAQSSFALITEEPGVFPHMDDAGFWIGQNVEVANLFRFCGQPPEKVLNLMIIPSGEEGTSLPGVVQVQRYCTTALTNFAAGGRCIGDAHFIRTALPQCEIPTWRELDLESVFCGCPCDDSNCECPGVDDPMTVQISFTGTKWCPFGNALVTTQNFTCLANFNPATGFHEGTFTTTDSIPVAYYSVLYHCGAEPPGSRSGFVALACNIPNPDGPFTEFLDDFGDPVGPGCVVDEFLFGEIDPFTINENCTPCTRTYLVQFKCDGMLLQPDGSLRPDFSLARISVLTPDGEISPDSSGLGTMMEGGCRRAHFEFFAPRIWGNGAVGFKWHSFAGFIDGLGQCTVTW